MDEQNTKMQNKVSKTFSKSETILLVIMSLLIGFSIGLLNNWKSTSQAKQTVGDEYLDRFVDSYNYVVNNYYEEVDKNKLINGAIDGMLQSLDDPYSIYFDEDYSRNFSITLDGSYEGIGIQFIKDLDTGEMLITNIIKQSPAEEAGLKPGDIIISIDDLDVSKITSSEFVSVVKNKSGDSFTLKVISDNNEKTVVINKRNINLQSVESNLFEVDDKKVGYIYIGIFANNTTSQFLNELEKLENSKIDYLILDVRGNSGGHLTTVESILNLFLNKTQILYQFEQSGEVTPIYGINDINKDYEIITLGDESSASASEVLIASLKENLGSKFIGKKTYGKGTVQELVTLPDGTQYKVTIKKWLTPNGNWVNDSKGIIPDIEIDLDNDYYKTYDNNDDTQLQRALQYIKNRE